MEAGFEGIGTYITRRHNTSAQYISTWKILDLCERSSQRPAARVSRRWWDQDGLYLEGSKKKSSGSGGIGWRGDDMLGGGNAPRNDYRPGMRPGIQSSNSS